MKRLLIFGMSVLLLQGVAGSVTPAAAAFPTICSGGSIAAGTYYGLQVTGNCTFAAGTVTVVGNLQVADGAVLNDHAASSATVHVSGNVLVGKGAVLGLGTYNPTAPHDTTVGGNIVADQPLTLYLGGITVQRNVISNGGGSGPAGPFRNFPIKDDTIGGSLTLQGWHGGWLGVIRVHVGGSAIVSNNVSVLTDTGPGIDLDSNEVMTNTISGNLICQGNVPAAQVNAGDGGQPNTVGGYKIGQCAGL